MENYGIKINVVTFIFMFFFAGEITNSIQTQRNDPKSLLKEMFYSQDT